MRTGFATTGDLDGLPAFHAREHPFQVLLELAHRDGGLGHVRHFVRQYRQLSMAGVLEPEWRMPREKIRDGVEMHWFKVEIGSGGTFPYVKPRGLD